MEDNCQFCSLPHIENICRGLGVDKLKAKKYGCGSIVWNSGFIDRTDACISHTALKQRLALAKELLGEWKESVTHDKYYDLFLKTKAFLANAPTRYVAVRREDGVSMQDFWRRNKGTSTKWADETEAFNRLKAALEGSDG